MDTIVINEYLDVIGPETEMAGPVQSKSTIRTVVPPGCWGPMITPSVRSGHEVSRPVYVEDAEPGDAIAITVRDIHILSNFTSSGDSEPIEGRFHQDPTVNAVCPSCGTTNPETYLKGVGSAAIRCKTCGAEVLPQTIRNGYTLIYDENHSLGISAPETVAKSIALGLHDNSALPKGSKQHPVNILAKADIEQMITRVEPMVGNIGTIPARMMPSSRNAGDALANLQRNPHFSSVEKADLTDAHMDVNTVTTGSIVIAPVKVSGGGVYIGDVHSIQGNGELAGHTADVTAEVTVTVELIKNVAIEGPIVLPPVHSLAKAFRPITDEEYRRAETVAKSRGYELTTRSLPVQFIGSGISLEEAINNAIERASHATGLNASELRNRATVTGSVDIGRISGVVYITMMLPEEILDRMGIAPIVQTHYQNQ